MPIRMNRIHNDHTPERQLYDGFDYSLLILFARPRRQASIRAHDCPNCISYTTDADLCPTRARSFCWECSSNTTRISPPCPVAHFNDLVITEVAEEIIRL